MIPPLMLPMPSFRPTSSNHEPTDCLYAKSDVRSLAYAADETAVSPPRRISLVPKAWKLERADHSRSSRDEGAPSLTPPPTSSTTTENGLVSGITRPSVSTLMGTGGHALRDCIAHTPNTRCRMCDAHRATAGHGDRDACPPRAARGNTSNGPIAPQR